MFFKIAQKGKSGWELYLATLILIVIGFVVGQIPLGLAMVYAAEGDVELIEEVSNSSNFSALGLDENVVLVLMILSFLGASLALWLGITQIHKRAFKTLITPFQKIDWSKLFFSFGLWFGLTIIAEAAFYFMNPDNYVLQFQLDKFLPLIAIALLLLPIQTSTEEFLFRGYFMQGIGLISKYRWIPLMLTSIGFGLMHGMNPEVMEFGFEIMMTYYIGVGLFLGIITLMDDSMELALGIHAGTNIYGALMVTFSASAVQTPAIFSMKEVDVLGMLIAFFVMAIIFVAIVAKKYNWNDWSKIYGIIAKDSEEIGRDIEEHLIA